MEKHQNSDPDLVTLIPGKILSGKQRKLIGSSAERYFGKFIREVWKQEYCVTTRFNSKFLDKCGIDFDNVPFRLQLKAGVQKGMRPVLELMYVHQQSIACMPPDSEWLRKPKILIHHKTNSVGRNKSDGFNRVYMTFLDFDSMIKKNEELLGSIPYQLMTNKEETGSEFDVLVVLDLDSLTKIITSIFPPHLKPIQNDSQVNK